MDMHSGGGAKEKYAKIYIEAPEAEAKVIFFNRFGHNPERVSCTCCGDDYSISSDESFAQLSAYDRGCRFDRSSNKYVEESSSDSYLPYLAVDDYANDKGVLLIRDHEIKPEERAGDVPTQGYVWAE